MYCQQKNRRLLAISARRLGDALFATPFYKKVKQDWPEAHLTVITVNKLSYSLLQNNPHLDEVLLLKENENIQALVGKYDFGLNIHDCHLARHFFQELALPYVCFPATVPGKARTEILLYSWQKLSGHCYQPNSQRYEIFPQSTDQQAVQQLLLSEGINKEQTLIGIHLGCHGLSKSRYFFTKKQHPKVWPLQKFIALGQWIKQYSPQTTIVLTGSKEEEKLAKKFMKKCSNSLSLLSKTSISQLALLMQQFNAFVCCDTGTLHIASSTDVPIIALFRSAEIKNTGPYPYCSARHHVLHRPLVSDIPIEEVSTTLAAVLNKSRTQP